MCRFCELEGTNDDSLDTGTILYDAHGMIVVVVVVLLA